MRHRIKAGKVGSFTPEKQKVEIEQLENREVAEENKNEEIIKLLNLYKHINENEVMLTRAANRGYEETVNLSETATG